MDLTWALFSYIMVEADGGVWGKEEGGGDGKEEGGDLGAPLMNSCISRSYKYY